MVMCTLWFPYMETTCKYNSANNYSLFTYLHSYCEVVSQSFNHLIFPIYSLLIELAPVPAENAVKCICGRLYYVPPKSFHKMHYRKPPTVTRTIITWKVCAQPGWEYDFSKICIGTHSSHCTFWNHWRYQRQNPVAESLLKLLQKLQNLSVSENNSRMYMHYCKI